MHLISPSVSRVQRNTAAHVNKRIADETTRRVQACAIGGRDLIDPRLVELDGEWDIERVIGTIAPIGILAGVALGFKANKKFLAVPTAIAGFLILHGLQGWAPPLPVLRRLGFRTAEEIDEERYALRALRGDFKDVPTVGRIEDVMAAVKH
jgi:hypothetical protein